MKKLQFALLFAFLAATFMAFAANPTPDVICPPPPDPVPEPVIG